MKNSMELRACIHSYEIWFRITTDKPNGTKPEAITLTKKIQIPHKKTQKKTEKTPKSETKHPTKPRKPTPNL